MSEDLQAICDEVEREYGMGGLSDGLYGDFAKEVAKRYAARAWQPIDTAPKGRDAEGRMQYVLLVGQYPMTPGFSDVYQCWWNETHQEWERWPHDFPPTHWMPGPKPPSVS